MINIIIKLSIVIAIIASLIFGANYYVSAIDTSDISEEVVKALSSVSGEDAKIENVDLVLLPYPSAIVRRITVNRGIFVDKVIIYPNLISLLKGEIKAGKVEANNIYINPKKTGIAGKSINQIISSISKIDTSIKEFSSRKIWDTAVNNRIILQYLKIVKNNRDIKTSFIFSKDIKLEDDTKYSKVEDNFQSKTKISSSSFLFNISRIFNENKSLSGEFRGDIKNLGVFVRDTSSYFDFMFNNYVKTPNPLTISGKILNNDEYTILDNIEIKSSDMDIKASYWSSVDRDNNLLDVKILKLNLTELSSGPDISSDGEESLFSIDTTKLKIQMQGSNINFLGDVISSFTMTGEGDGSVFLVENCYGLIGNDGRFDLSGKISDNKYRPKFDGRIEISHKDFNKLVTDSAMSNLSTEVTSDVHLSSEISITPVDLMFAESKLTIGGQSLRGSANIKLVGKEKLLLGDLVLDDLNLDKSNLPVIRTVYNYFKSLGIGMSDQSYIGKYASLRSYPIRTNVNLTGDNLIIENQPIERLSIVSSFESGQFRIDNYSVDLGRSYIKGDGRIIANSLKPQIKININEGEIYTDAISKEDMNKVVNYLNSDFSLSSVDISSDGFLNKLKIADFEAKNISWSSDGKNGALSLGKSNMDVFGGNANFTGNFVVNPIKLNLAFGIDGFKIEDAVAVLPGKIAIDSGFASINGQISSSGTTAEQIGYNLFMKGEFLGKKVNVVGIDMENLINKLSTKDLNGEMAQSFIDESVNSGQTILDEVKGSYELSSGMMILKDINASSRFFTAASGIAISTYDYSMDLNSIFSFYPVGARIFSPSSVTPIKLRLISKGNLFDADKLLKFNDLNDISRISRILNNPTYESPRNF
jgi:hypothetical protein